MFNISIRRENSLAIDLGNDNTIISDKHDNTSSQPSYIAIEKSNKQVKAIGQEAYLMLGRAQERTKVLKPLKGGVIINYDSANCMLKALVEDAHHKSSFFYAYEYVIAGIPFDTTEVERRALRDALAQFKSSHTYLVFEPIAAALGMGLSLEEPDGKMLIDIGGGITEIVVLSLSGVVSYTSLKIAGDTFNEDIQDHFRKVHNVTLGNKVAEEIKLKVGAASVDISPVPETMQVIGKDLLTGLPKSIEIDHIEIADILDASVQKIENAILQTLEQCPPELAGDIYGNGLHLTGGSSLLRGLTQRLEKKTKLSVHQDSDPLQSVIRGLSTIIKSPKTFKHLMFK